MLKAQQYRELAATALRVESCTNLLADLPKASTMFSDRDAKHGC